MQQITYVKNGTVTVAYLGNNMVLFTTNTFKNGLFTTDMEKIHSFGITTQYENDKLINVDILINSEKYYNASPKSFFSILKNTKDDDKHECVTVSELLDICKVVNQEQMLGFFVMLYIKDKDSTSGLKEYIRENMRSLLNSETEHAIDSLP